MRRLLTRRKGTRRLVEFALGQRHLAFERTHPPDLERRRRPVHLHGIAEPLFCRKQPALARIARTDQQIAQHLPANGEQRRHPFRRLFTRAKVHRHSGAVTPLQREERPGHVRGDDGFGEAVVLSLLLGRVHGLQRLAVAANS